MKVETQIHLNKYKARPYQLPMITAIEKGYKRVMAILPRRAGKDITAFNICIRQALRRVGTIFYVFPTFQQGRRILWDAITNDGMRILDFIPKELVESRNEQLMRIRLINGSQIQIVGSDNYDNTLVGTNCIGIVFSEYALTDPNCYSFVRPILSANDGWALFISTPRGKNHLWELYNIAMNNPEDWFAYRLTVLDTGHIPIEEIERERASGELSDDLIEQEYYCSFTLGVEGSYYAKYIEKMRLNNQIGNVPWEPGFKVHTCWDIGFRDSTTIIFYQVVGMTIRIIDCYERSKEGMEHYIDVVRNKPYNYGRHIGPHDIRVHEFTSGLSRWEKARQLGVTFTLANDLPIVDGIEAVRTTLSKVWIDESKCTKLIKALENYRQEFDAKRKVYKPQPLHDIHSHFCFTSDTLILTRSGMRQIIDIQPNDEVFTMEGWKKCLKSGMTIQNAKLVEVTFNDGMKVRCTPDHLFMTVNGWRSASELTKDTKILSSLMRSLHILMESYSDYGQLKNTFLTSTEDYTEKFGKRLLDQYQKIATYIIEIIIPLTTISGISNVYPLQNIFDILSLIAKEFRSLREEKLLNGISQNLEENGIKNMLNEWDLENILKEKLGIVYSVRKNLTALSGALMDKNSVTLTVKHPIIVDIKLLEETENVYDIEVEDVHHFSLANGSVVHNSDSMRYLCVSLGKTQDSLSPKDLDKRYQEAMYGEQNTNMPSIFRTDLPNY